jgi:competence protein ComEC
VIRVRELPAEAPRRTADSDPTVWLEAQGDTNERAVSVDLAVEAVEEVTPDVAWMASTRGGVRVTIIGAMPELHCGELLEAPLRMKAPERYPDPGAWQYADYLLQQGIGAHANVKASRVQRLAQTIPQ